MVNVTACPTCKDNHYIGADFTKCPTCAGVSASENIEWRPYASMGNSGEPFCRKCGLRAVIVNGVASCPECDD